mmetsp:Transcript_47824/g.89518  ORF Transcript_47824/g.89518 Transcript_47824/m.89518 type:complete len:253 (-) Transcript_47824:563-1321(-)
MNPEICDVAEHLVTDWAHLYCDFPLLDLFHQKRVAKKVEAMSQSLRSQQYRVHGVQRGPVALAIVQHERHVHTVLPRHVGNLQKLGCVVESRTALVLLSRCIPAHNGIRPLRLHLEGVGQVLGNGVGTTEADAGSDQFGCQVRSSLLHVFNDAGVHIDLLRSFVLASVKVRQLVPIVEQLDTEFHMRYAICIELCQRGLEVLLDRGPVRKEGSHHHEDVRELAPNLRRGQLLILLLNGQPLQKLVLEVWLTR